MSISPDYFKYLDHFSNTVTVRELFESPNTRDAIALRHDVDYDLDLALEMSYWENRRGIRSTYYLLHSAEYWDDPRLIDKCLQLQDFGHEVGLHLNILTDWMTAKVNDVEQALNDLVVPLRDAGVRLTGISSHGDPLCYKHQFINYWCFAELKPPDPVSAESGLSAEGIGVKEHEFQIIYPASHQLVRQDGEIVNLWSASMNKLGLEYDAIHVQHDSYFTDSGGSWHRSDDPIKQEMRTGRHQVLMHPIYWRGNQKIYFFLSTARSGSKWLVNFLQQATPLKAQHEFSLNHYFRSEELIAEKRTAEGFTALVDKPDEVRKLLIDARTWIEELPEDYAEANVYLERFLPLMKEIFPDAAFVHLHRNPRDVVRSIINRDWYDTPEDSRHPIMTGVGWESLSQFEKACLYVKMTNYSLLRECDYQIIFERMVTDTGYLYEKLLSLGIPVFPRLAKSEYDKKINKNYNYEFPDYEKWTGGQKALFHSMCDMVMKDLGYESQSSMIHKYKVSFMKFLQLKFKTLFQKKKPEVIFHTFFNISERDPFTLKGCTMKVVNEGMKVVPEGEKHAHVLFGGGKWHELKSGDGWERYIAFYYRGYLDADISTSGSAQLVCLMYNNDGKLMAKRSLGQIKEQTLPLSFSFKVRSNAERFNLALYMSSFDLPGHLVLKRMLIEKVPLRGV